MHCLFSINIHLEFYFLYWYHHKDNDIHDIKDEGNIVAQDIDSKDIVTKDNRIQDIKDKVTGGNIEGGESW